MRPLTLPPTASEPLPTPYADLPEQLHSLVAGFLDLDSAQALRLTSSRHKGSVDSQARNYAQARLPLAQRLPLPQALPAPEALRLTKEIDTLLRASQAPWPQDVNPLPVLRALDAVLKRPYPSLRQKLLLLPQLPNPLTRNSFYAFDTNLQLARHLAGVCETLHHLVPATNPLRRYPPLTQLVQTIHQSAKRQESAINYIMSTPLNALSLTLFTLGYAPTKLAHTSESLLRACHYARLLLQ